MIQEHDEPVLRHLVDVGVELLVNKEPNKYGFKLRFEFAPNEYFCGTLVLTKTYVVAIRPDVVNPHLFEVYFFSFF